MALPEIGWLAKSEKNASTSSCVGGSSIGIGVGDFDALLQVDDEGGVGELECLNSSECRAAILLFFPTKINAFYRHIRHFFNISWYDPVRFLSVTVMESLIHTPDSIAQRRDTT